MTLETLIDKQDTAEIVRDQITAILATETAAQVALARAGGKPFPTDWKIRVFEERAAPWELFEESDKTPLVNVWWESSNFDESKSNVVESQHSAGTFHIDCYGHGQSADNPAGGHATGDRLAVAESQKALRLCRNILMAAEYTYLGLRGTVWRRWTASISNFQPQQDNTNVRHIVGARLSLRVEFREYSPQVVPETLETLTANVIRTEDGEVLVPTEYDYTA